MKKRVLLSICLLIGAWTLSAQQTIYIIDNETVENFDGSQLKDRTIRDYKINTKGSGRNAITVHAITTSPSVFSVTGSFKPLNILADTTVVINPTHRKIVYVIDGVVHEDVSAFNSISPSDIENITVVKEGSPEQLIYGEDVVVMKITTKKEKFLKALKAIPGVTVDEEGKITYNGRAVKSISINGREYSVDPE
ncbi:MAG: hypothetical protein J6S99_01685 [Bacteroidales bacterium]|nr:hypothetical protein [Bacteroidales bacterium]